jgi:superfamily II DNA or RNA helicase
MGSLKDYKWDTRYSSATHNLVEDFFIPALMRSKNYYRIAGYFSSTSIAAALRGISAFVENGEKMYLIIGNELTLEDVEAINNGHIMIDDLLKKKWEDCKKDFDKDIIRKRFELLSWLIANNKLEVKIGINKDANGNYLPSEKSKFHEKILIFEDFEGNRIQVDGSLNETWKGWMENRESFCVHKNWVEGNDIFITTAKEQFDKVWLNLDNTCEIISLPEAINKDLLSIIPKNKPLIREELDLSSRDLERLFNKKSKNLRRHQKDAIEAWENNNYKGIFEMATGTGKTFTSLMAVKNLDKKFKALIIGVPQKELANQWVSECESVFEGVKKRIIPCHSGVRWKSNLARDIRQSGREKSLCIIISVLNTMRNPLFIDNIKNILDDSCLIIDEVHEIGSNENRKLLEKLGKTYYRIGLSATPDRMWDNEGNDAIKGFFGEEGQRESTFVWGMEEAISPPEGYDPSLCPYEYHIHDCSFNKEERDKYEDISNQIRIIYGRLTRGGKDTPKGMENHPSLKSKFTQRANIVKKCMDKLRVLDYILDNYSKDLKKCLVYCNDKADMEEVTLRILDKGFNARKFYGEMGSIERQKVFDSFVEENVQFVVAIKCLDQGIDIPQCDSAIILASSKNPREYVQRRGRILRLHEGKDRAIVHDLLVFPIPLKKLESGEEKIPEFEANLLKGQLERMRIFTENSLNCSENYLKMLNFGEVIIKSK